MEGFYKNILRMFIRKTLEDGSTQIKRKYGSIIKALHLDIDKTEIAVLELCIEAAGIRIGQLTNQSSREE